MDIGSQLLFFFAGLGVFNGALMVLYFLFILKPRKWINILFGLLMLMLCIRIGKSLFHVFTDVDRIYRQIGLSACIMIGPFLYVYLRHFTKRIASFKKAFLPHMLLPFLGILLLGIIWPYEQYPDIWNYTMVKIIYGVWIIYMIASWNLIIPSIKKAISSEASIEDKWGILLTSSISLLCIAYNLAYYGFPYLSGPLLFSIIFYVLIGFLIPKKHRSVILLQTAQKYRQQKLSESKANALLDNLSEGMRNQKIYLNQDIKLATVAQSVHASPHEVSQVINNQLGISFNQYINQFRIAEACELLESSDHLTVEGIGQEVGFKSRSAFYKAFKTIMQQTPVEYKRQVKVAKQ